MFEYKEAKDIVINEINSVLEYIDKKKVEELVSLILKAEKVFVVGSGRSLLMLQAFVKRLNHLGIKGYYVGEINEPPITNKDILIVGSYAGISIIPVSIVKIAKKYNAKIIYIGTNSKSPICKIAHLFIKFPSLESKQLMNSSFEQSLLLFCDVICFISAKEKNLDIKELWKNHSNLQ